MDDPALEADRASTWVCVSTAGNPLSMRLTRDESDREQTFGVNGVRTVTSVATWIETMTVNSGN